MATFFWYDYETWGLNPAKDKPSQFAGIRTDMDFNIVGEPEMFYCRLPDDYLPSVEPAIITGITPEITQSKGLAEYQFAGKINQQFSQPDTCIVGYNTLRFDEEFSRYLFYRNFYDPYEYSWQNGNSRWDIIDLVRAAYALRPESIIWPTNESGLPSFKLEDLTQANGISHEQAHDAMSDVYATIALAKLIKQKIPKLFNYYFKLRDKHEVKAFISTQPIKPLVHVSGMFGSARGNISIVAPVAWHPVNKNAVIVVDLSKDISPLLDLTADEIRERLYTKQSQLGYKRSIPVKLIHINKSPFIAETKVLLAENKERLGIDLSSCLSNLERLNQYSELSIKMTEVFQQETPFDHQGNVDAMLYDGFFSDQAKNIFKKIRHSSPEKLLDFKASVNDNRFDELLFRYRGRNFYNTLTSEEKQRWIAHRQVSLQPLLTDYFLDLDNQAENFDTDNEKLAIIASLRDYALELTREFD